MTGWEPATAAEAALGQALQVNDQEQYFRILSQLELFLPVSADSLAGRAPIGWGTWSTGGRTHVLAFTSPTAMRICLGESAASARQLRYAELAAAWPSAEWWLAVNPGLPIEGYLPAWFVAQLARGDARLPGRESVPAAVPPQTLERDERRPAGRAAGPTPPPRARATASVPVPPPSGPDRRAAGSHETVAASHGTAGERAGVPRSASPAGPTTATALSGPPAAASSGIAGAVPGWRGNGPTTAEEGPKGLPRRPVPSEAASGRRDQEGSVATAVRPPAPTPGRAEVPAPGRAPENTVGGAPRPPEPPARAEPDASGDPAVPEFTPANQVESNLLEAAGGGSTDSFLSTLLLATVALPVAPESAPGARPGDHGFAWRTESLDGEPYVVVFTSPERLVDHLGGSVDTVAVRFVQLIRRWPDPGWSFAVNPGTPVGAKLPGAEIMALANWAAEVGLGDDADEAEAATDPEPAPQPATSDPRSEPARPTMMQKSIAPAQVGYYRERGYDRVSGFVHRANEVAHLTSPAQLYAALGLGYPNSPFTPDADEVYVLRWPVHRPALYRIPYGGQNESAMRAMQGWVIERAPFRGNGFAPGDSRDVVAEFKVDSVRLPHGAQLWHLGADGSERLIATLDSDGPRWHSAGDA